MLEISIPHQFLNLQNDTKQENRFIASLDAFFEGNIY